MGIPGISRAVREVNDKIAQFARNPEVLIFMTGEPGTERALVARLVHEMGLRSAERFVRITANWKLPTDFSDRIEEADQGTLFINLAREFPVDMQYTLLELALDQTFTDPLSGETRKADVALILTTSMSLEELNERSPLLPDLRERMEQAHIDLPSLRHRREDIPALVRFALARARDTGQSQALRMDRQVLALLRAHAWPGNAEELLLVSAQAALKAKGETVRLADLPEDFVAHVPDHIWKMAQSIPPDQDSVSSPFPPSELSTEEPAQEYKTRTREDFPQEPLVPAAFPLPTQEASSGLATQQTASSSPTPPFTAFQDRWVKDSPSSSSPQKTPPQPDSLKSGFADQETVKIPFSKIPPSLHEMLPAKMKYPSTPSMADQDTRPGLGQGQGAEASEEENTQGEEMRLRTPAPASPTSASQVPPEIESSSQEGVNLKEEPPPSSVEEVERGIRQLSSRLHAQTATLSAQFKGPLPRATEVGKKIAAARKWKGVDALSWEEELSGALDAILSLRRQMAVLNKREHETAYAIRDLLLRFDYISAPPSSSEAEYLASQLSEVDAIIERVTRRAPKVTQDIQQNIQRLLGKTKEIENSH